MLKKMKTTTIATLAALALTAGMSTQASALSGQQTLNSNSQPSAIAVSNQGTQFFTSNRGFNNYGYGGSGFSSGIGISINTGNFGNRGFSNRGFSNNRSFISNRGFSSGFNNRGFSSRGSNISFGISNFGLSNRGFSNNRSFISNRSFNNSRSFNSRNIVGFTNRGFSRTRY